MVINNTYEKIVIKENRNIFTYVDYLFSCGINKWSKECMGHTMTYFEGKEFLNGIDLLVSTYDTDIQQWGILLLKTEHKSVLKLISKSPIFNGVSSEDYASSLHSDMVDYVKSLDLFKNSDIELLFTPNEFIFDIIENIIKEEKKPYIVNLDYGDMLEIGFISDSEYESTLKSFQAMEERIDDEDDDEDDYGSDDDEEDEEDEEVDGLDEGLDLIRPLNPFGYQDYNMWSNINNLKNFYNGGKHKF